MTFDTQMFKKFLDAHEMKSSTQSVEVPNSLTY